MKFKERIWDLKRLLFLKVQTDFGGRNCAMNFYFTKNEAAGWAVQTKFRDRYISPSNVIVF